MKYPEKNAALFYIETMHFVLNEEGQLWSLCEYEWRHPGEKKWNYGYHDGYLHVGKDTFEIREICKKVYYRVDRNGYELVVEKSLEEMLKEIAERVDLIEYIIGEAMFALMANASVNIGCASLKRVLEENGMVTVIHSTNERTLYRLNKEKVTVLSFFEQHSDQVRELHKKLVTP